MQRQNKWMSYMASGLLIGVGCILPGVSGGVMAVSFGLYRPMLDAVTDFLHHPRQSLRLLMPLGLWIALGIVLGAIGLAGAMARHGRLMLFLFTGFILGGIPDLLGEAEQNERFRPVWLLSLLAGVLAGIPLCLLQPAASAVQTLSPLQTLVCGMLEGLGTVIPGLSTSLVLIHLGWYQAYLRAMTSVGSLPLLACGFAVSALMCIRAVRWLFDRYTGHATYAVLGFLLVSVALVFPGFQDGVSPVVDCAVLAAGVLTAHWLGKK